MILDPLTEKINKIKKEKLLRLNSKNKNVKSSKSQIIETPRADLMICKYFDLY